MSDSSLSDHPVPTSSLRVTGLRTDHRDLPLAVESRAPELSWRLESDIRNVRQAGYRIRVASTEQAARDGVGDLWDSGHVASSSSVLVPYAGVGLTSRQRCWWTVEIETTAGQTAVSEPAWWEMGLLSGEDWTAEWVVADDAQAVADREFQVSKIQPAATDADVVARTFTLEFSLPVASTGGTLLAEAYFGGVADGIWIDGTLAAPAAATREQWHEPLDIGPLEAGPHRLDVRLVPVPPVVARAGEGKPLSLVFFARFDLEDGGALRLGSGPDWTTRTADAAPEPVEVTPLEPERPASPSPAMYLRTDFSADDDVVSARLYATALGVYEPRLNGARVTDAVLAPEMTDYAQRVLYQVYDVTDAIRAGSNVLGAVVSDGWFASHPGRYGWAPPPRRLLAQLELTYADGRRETIGTGEGWRISRSPILHAPLCVGEVIDARLAQPGWDDTGFDDAHWETAAIGEAPDAALVAQVTPPIRATRELRPISVDEVAPGVQIVDFGENFAGWCRIRLRGSAGDRVRLRFGERLNADGTLNQFVLLGGYASDLFVLGGDPDGDVFEPRFVYHGFRYAEVTGASEPVTADSITGVVIHSDLPMTGTLRIGNPLLQTIWDNTVRGLAANLVGIFTDCPNRAERLGWMADMASVWDTAAFAMDVSAMSRRRLDDVRDAQTSEGTLSIIAPLPASIGEKPEDGPDPVWADGAIIAAWTAWRWYGDTTIADRNLATITEHLDYLHRHNPDLVWRNKFGHRFADWLSPAFGPGEHPHYNPGARTPTSDELIGTAYWAFSTGLAAEMAAACGRAEEAAALAGRRDRIRDAFAVEFIAPDGRIEDGTQTAQILGLAFDLVPEHLRAAAGERLAEAIVAEGVALTTGYASTRYLLDAVADTGRVDLAYGLMLRTENPSWGYMVEQGATTMWERWDGTLAEDHNEGSQNHPTFGSIGGFMFRRVAGIAAASSAFERIEIRPELDARVPSAGADYDSVRGRISTDWEWREGRFRLDVTIPANATARVHVPATGPVTEGGRDLDACDDLIVAERAPATTVVEIGSGTYRFESAYAPAG